MPSPTGPPSRTWISKYDFSLLNGRLAIIKPVVLIGWPAGLWPDRKRTWDNFSTASRTHVSENMKSSFLVRSPFLTHSFSRFNVSSHLSRFCSFPKESMWAKLFTCTSRFALVLTTFSNRHLQTFSLNFKPSFGDSSFSVSTPRPRSKLNIPSRVFEPPKNLPTPGNVTGTPCASIPSGST